MPPSSSNTASRSRLRDMASRARTRLSWTLRSPLPLTAAILAFTGYLAYALNEHYAIGNWLFWSYAGYCGLAVVFTAACLCIGHRVVTWLAPASIPVREHVVMSLGTGLYVFFAGMFVAGLLHLYGTAFFVAWPTVLLAIGGPSAVRYFRRVRARITAARARVRPTWSFLDIVVFAFGLMGLAMIYFSILTPDNVAYDSHWYHLPIAEHFVAAGGIGGTPEGWYQYTYPHLSTFLYTWAFLLPKSGLFDRIELCAHLEFAIFLWTLFSIPVLVRWIVPGAKTRRAWVALFLFPGIFLYDASLTVASDHIAAFWAIPIFLALRRALRTLSPRWCALLALMMAGAISTKYQSLVLVLSPVAAVVVRLVWLAIKRWRSGWRAVGGLFRGPALATGCALAFTTPHWLANWVWHGDPLYPFFHKYLRVHPWTPDSADFFEYYYKRTQMWRPGGTFGEQLQETATAIFTFAFKPHDWPTFHRDLPVIGFLFTATLACAPFLRKTKRLWAVLVAGHIGVFAWYWMSHQDRYLQVLLPWFVAAAAAFIALVWRTHWITRGALVALIALQVIWGGDIYFFPTHAMLGGTPVKVVGELMSSGFRGDMNARRHLYGQISKVGESLPPGSKVLLHEMHVHLGLAAMSVSDGKAWQGGIAYGHERSPRALYEKLRSWGVTHVLWEPGRSWSLDSIAGDLVFWDFATKYTGEKRTFGHLVLAEMADSLPPERAWLDEKVALLLAPGTYAPGMYRLSDATVLEEARRQPFPQPRQPLVALDLNAVARDASFIAYDPACRCTLPPGFFNDFTRVATRGNVQLWVRNGTR